MNSRMKSLRVCPLGRGPGPPYIESRDQVTCKGKGSPDPSGGEPKGGRRCNDPSSLQYR